MSDLMQSDLTWIRGGRIIDPASNRDGVGDLFLADGVMVADPGVEARAHAKVIEADGLVVTPGLIDIHVHFREPGQVHKECIETGSRAGAAGGFTTVVVMPNTSPVADNPGTIQQIKDSIERHAVIRVLPTGTLTRGMQGETLAPIGSLRKAGVVAVTDDGKCIQSNELMRRAVEYAAMFDLPVMDHCQDYALTKDAVMHEGDWSLRLGVRGWPSAAEDIIVARNIILSFYTGAHIHLQHISSSNSVEAIRRAKARGIRITAEVSPHHLCFTDEALRDYNTHFKMNPPLRTQADQEALVEGLRDGTIDIIATDHAPHTDTEKDVELDYAPFGVIGLETAFSASYQRLVKSGELALTDLIALMTYKPAKILGLEGGTLQEGRPADVVLIDPEASWEVDAQALQSRSANCPWHGQRLPGHIVRTFYAGREVWDGQSIVETAR